LEGYQEIYYNLKIHVAVTKARRSFFQNWKKL